MGMGFAQKRQKAHLGQWLFPGEMHEEPKAAELWSPGPDSSPSGQRAAPEAVAASVGAGWRSAKAGTTGVAFRDVQCLDPGLHWG